MKPIVEQLFDPATFTYTYIVADPISKDGLIIDPVLEHVDRDFKLIVDRGIDLKWILETHVHADHVTSAFLLREKMSAKIGMGKFTHVQCADQLFIDGEVISMGRLHMSVMLTPGHTNGCTSYYLLDHAVFTGDTLMIDGCGRTDFQEGSSETLFESVREKLFNLPDDTLVYPSHDYKGRIHSTIGHEKNTNARLKLSHSKEHFMQIMTDLKLDAPTNMQRTVAANTECGKV